MEFEPEQSGLGAGHRIGAQRLLRPGNDLFGSDGLDPDVKRAGLARRIDARLDQPHILIEHRVLGGEPERSEEHTSELPSLMRKSSAVFRLNTKTSYHL